MPASLALLYRFSAIAAISSSVIAGGKRVVTIKPIISPPAEAISFKLIFTARVPISFVAPVIGSAESIHILSPKLNAAQSSPTEGCVIHSLG